MKETIPFPMKPISIDEIKSNDDINWSIKYDLLTFDTIYEIKLSDDIMCNSRSDEILFMRKYNKTNTPYRKFFFNLYKNQVFYAMKNVDYSHIYKKDIYSEENLDNYYDDREKR